MTRSRHLRPGLAAALLLLTTACAGLPMGGDGEDASLKALAVSDKGDAQATWTALYEAQRQAPGDPRTLLAAARYYEKVGRLILARQYYQAVLLHSRPVSMPPGPEGERQRSPEAFARIALDRLDGRTVTPQRAIVDLKPAVNRTEIAAIAPAVKPAPPEPSPDPSPAYDPIEDDPVVERFRILTQWVTVGLITSEEYTARRSPNLGALLVYAASPPALDLYGAPPDIDQMEVRLRQGVLGKARADLLDTLVPAKPKTRTLASKQDPASLDEAVSRIDALAQAGLVSVSEKERETTAIARLRGKEASSPPSHPTPGANGVHLVSLDDPGRAPLSWRTLTSTHPELTGLSYRVARAEIGMRVTHRVIAGPVADAPGLCRQLRMRGQYCMPMGMP